MTATSPTASTWWIEVFLGETDGVSTATATLHTRERSSLSTHGTARLDPHDHDDPEIGFELATARALSELAGRLLESAAEDIASLTGGPRSGRGRQPRAVTVSGHQAGANISAYCSRWRSPTYRSRTRACAATPRRSASPSSSRTRRSARREGHASWGSSRSRPSRSWTIWSWIPPTLAGDDRTRLPHRLGDGEPEPLDEALLDDDGRVALHGVDDERVLVEVVHGHRREMDPAADAVGQAPPLLAARGEHLRAFRVVGDAGDVGSDEHQVRAGGRSGAASRRSPS